MPFFFFFIPPKKKVGLNRPFTPWCPFVYPTRQSKTSAKILFVFSLAKKKDSLFPFVSPLGACSSSMSGIKEPRKDFYRHLPSPSYSFLLLLSHGTYGAFQWVPCLFPRISFGAFLQDV